MNDEANAADETVYFTDTSALVRAYFHDEPDHEVLHELLLSSGRKVVASELVRLEATRAVAAAQRAGRLDEELAAALLDQLDWDLGGDGVVLLIPLDGSPTIARASEIVRAHPVGSLDAMHLATADREGRALAADDPLVFVTRDEVQAVAAQALGLQTA